jgi:hypothetical protein
MAKCSAHGKEIGTLFFGTTAKRYMSDGKILRNYGFGWKLALGKIKPELAHLSPEALFIRARSHQAEWLSAHPAAAAYQKELHGAAGVSKRWKLHAAIQMMPDDPDGVWSECCDGYGDNVHADLDDIVTLCRLFKAAEAESKELRSRAS